MKLALLLLTASTAATANTNLCSKYGCPIGAPSTNDIVERPIYVLSNNRTTKFADWLAYKVSPTTIDGPSRSRTWKSDPEIDSRYTLEPSDYKDAWATIHTDRGHQVPLASFSNTPYWSDTNYLSNITPQSSDLNQGPWVKLENAVRSLVRTGENAYVVTGPLYEYYFATLPGANESHTIPSGYFKVVVTINGSNVTASAFIMEQTASRSLDYCGTEVTIDEVEQRSGLNLLPNLSSSKAWYLEANIGGLTSKLGC
ncbi:DNA/RNA non-specific endonuclease [Pseudoalteromonas sp. S16_S37]|uniref:DNA/RNA non-specific endonuclease n=1 Tax=Pseudoalteromonas sp. S16_S37 TaxID=2720228 RepID=UPI001680D9E2|nr:DNA/RNA non-specific endonuclease [Pseudoalteromonas sp. S16_S37]MBD1584684.1 DNA/RNA non-specific endonuclease [Pseudoalteromonas sp. S16_S37]